ncbi:MAG: hypothetical protein WBG92_06290 [Thiohalocapsa sp.]
MHDGVFRTRNLSTEERRLADCIQNHGLCSEEDRRQAVRNLLAKRCQLPRWLLPDAVPDDLFVRETLLRRIQDESPSPFVDAVGHALEDSRWDSGCYQQALEDGVSKALTGELDSAGRRFEASVTDGKPTEVARVLSRLRETTKCFAQSDIPSMASELVRRGRVRIHKQTLDIDGEIQGVDLSAL